MKKLEFSSDASLHNLEQKLGAMLGLQPGFVNPVKIIILYLFLTGFEQNTESEKFVFRKVTLPEMRKAVVKTLRSKSRNVGGALQTLNGLGLTQRAGDEEYELTPNGEMLVKFVHKIL